MSGRSYASRHYEAAKNTYCRGPGPAEEDSFISAEQDGGGNQFDGSQAALALQVRMHQHSGKWHRSTIEIASTCLV